MEGVGRKRERGEQIDTCWRKVEEVAARETGEERDREGAARGTWLRIGALPVGRRLVMPGETSSSFYILSYILWVPSFALGQ